MKISPLNLIEPYQGLVVYSLKEAQPGALFICPVACPPHHWTSIALSTAIDCRERKLGGGRSEGRSDDLLDPTAPE